MRLWNETFAFEFKSQLTVFVGVQYSIKVFD